MRHVLSSLHDILKATVERRTLPRLRLHMYKSRIAKLDEICRRIAGYRNDAKKSQKSRTAYKRPVVFFGDFTDEGGVKYGHRRPPIKALRHRLRLHANVIILDEYRSSKFCSTCSSKRDIPTNQLPELECVQVQQKIHAVVRCGLCKRIWNRDVNASRNLCAIVKHGLTNGWSRPPVFERS